MKNRGNTQETVRGGSTFSEKVFENGIPLNREVALTGGRVSLSMRGRLAVDPPRTALCCEWCPTGWAGWATGTRRLAAQ